MPALVESTSKRAFELLYDHVDLLEADYEIEINEAYDDVPVWEVRERADIQYALENGTSIFEYNDEADVCEAFLNITESLDSQFGFASPSDSEVVQA